MNRKVDEFSLLEHRGWQRVAAKYEEAWSGLTRLLIPHLLQAVEIPSGARVLDVACGPGYVAEAARTLGAEPVGVDFSAEMIGLARLRNPQIEFREGDAQALDFVDNSFDVVLMNFGLLHLAQPEAALSEAKRVLRAGGRYGFTVWAGPNESPGAGIVEAAVKAHADMSVEIPKGPDYFAFADSAKCRETLGRAGFDPASLVFQTVTVEWQVPTVSFLFESEQNAGVRTAALLARQTPIVLKAIKSQIENSVRTYAKGGGFAIPFAAQVITIADG